MDDSEPVEEGKKDVFVDNLPCKNRRHLYPRRNARSPQAAAIIRRRYRYTSAYNITPRRWHLRREITVLNSVQTSGKKSLLNFIPFKYNEKNKNIRTTLSKTDKNDRQTKSRRIIGSKWTITFK